MELIEYLCFELGNAGELGIEVCQPGLDVDSMVVKVVGVGNDYVFIETGLTVLQIQDGVGPFVVVLVHLHQAVFRFSVRSMNHTRLVLPCVLWVGTLSSIFA